MSDPTRYRVANNQAQLTLGGNILAVDPAGPLVTYDDYARLKAECQARQAENSVLAVECDSLKAEVERLTKAGDVLYNSMMEIGCNEMADNFQHDAWFGSMKDWNAAKEGKQS